MKLLHMFGMLLSLFALSIAGCGGGSGSGGGGSSTPADPNSPAAISISASSPLQLVSQGPVTITATVTPAGAGGVIANGTIVTFATTAGSLSSLTATTTGGVASVTLNSAVTVTASVTASVAGINSTPISVQFNTAFTKAIVKLATSGTLPANTTIGAIQATITAAPATGLSITDPDVSVSGAAGGLNILFVADTTSVAAVSLGLISSSGIQTGEFATLIYHITAGTIPTAANFSIATSPAPAITGLGPGSTAGISVIILSVTIQ